MRTLCLLTLALCSLAGAQQPSAQWLLTFQLVPGMDITKLTQQQMAVFMEHGKHLAGLYGKGIAMGGRTNETVGTTAVLILTCDEAAAKAAAADDPGTRAGYFKTEVRPFSLLLPPVPPAALASDGSVTYEAVAKFLLDGARKMPDDGYAFRPTPDVRTFAQVVGHVAEAQYIACSIARGQEYKPRNLEQSLSTKAELVPALEAAVGFCRESWSKLTPAALADPVTVFGQKRSKLGAMDLSTAHAFEHYGNMVTYLRLKGIVPPSSEK